MELKKQTTLHHFRSHVSISSASECWPWTGPKTRKGYGILKMMVHGEPLYLAHRAAWAIENGRPTQGLHVLHSCDNPACCNPAHLSIGTNADNVKDAVSKGRQSGRFHKIPDDVLADFRRSGDDPSVLAERFGLSRKTIVNRIGFSKRRQNSTFHAIGCSIPRETNPGSSGTCRPTAKRRPVAHRWPRTIAALLALSLGAALSAEAGGGAAELLPILTIVITDHAQVRSESLEQAKAYAQRICAGAGVSVTWADASIPSHEGLNLFLARTSPGKAMGRAAVTDGVAWVFVNRVIVLAAEKNMDERVLLGRVIVHEIGHLLRLDHARDGVMRAEIYTEAMEARFVFTPTEASAIRAELIRRTQAARIRST